jgi:SAM-dependent methyltransferase
VENIYTSGEYLENNQTWHEEFAPLKASLIAEIIRKNNLSLKSICEVGCGSGQILAELGKQLPGVNAFEGYEISPQAFEICKKKATGKIKFHLEDLTEKQNVHFDAMLIIDVIEHIENYFEFLRKLRPKSDYFIFHIPLDMFMWTLFREQMLIESKQRVGHIHNFSEKFIKSILTDLGFEIIDSAFTPPMFDNMTGKQKFVHLFRKFFFFLNKSFAVKTIGGYSILILAKTKK